MIKQWNAMELAYYNASANPFGVKGYIEQSTTIPKLRTDRFCHGRVTHELGSWHSEIDSGYL